MGCGLDLEEGPRASPQSPPPGELRNQEGEAAPAAPERTTEPAVPHPQAAAPTVAAEPHCTRQGHTCKTTPSKVNALCRAASLPASLALFDIIHKYL